MTDPPAAPPGVGLTIASLVSGYGEGVVIDGLSLAVLPGEAVAVLGRNGAGKTTLLRTVMGLVRARAGDIRYGGVSLLGHEPFRIARRGIAYVPQGREIFSELTVADNLALGNLRRRAADQAYELFPALAGRRSEPAGRLSGGQQQQLAIARALMAQPSLLLLDEPSEGIQPNVVDEIADRLGSLVAAQRMSLLLVEQNVELALALTSRAVFVEQGRIVATEPCGRLRGDPQLLARHLAL